MSIKSKSSTGHDEISNKVLKLIIPYIIEPLVHIFNQCFQTGTFPDSNKIAKVIPVFNSGKNKTDPYNYRPISLLPSISEILEKLMYKRMISFLFLHGLIHSHQYGFLNMQCLTLFEKLYMQLNTKTFPWEFFSTYPKLLTRFLTIFYGINYHLITLWIQR